MNNKKYTMDHRFPKFKWKKKFPLKKTISIFAAIYPIFEEKKFNLNFQFKQTLFAWEFIVIWFDCSRHHHHWHHLINKHWTKNDQSARLWKKNWFDSIVIKLLLSFDYVNQKNQQQKQHCTHWVHILLSTIQPWR